MNFGTDTAHVEFDPEKVSLPDLEKAVKEAGYDVVNQEVTIKVGGMMCATCVETIESALRELPGVVTATVNLGTEKAYVTYNPSLSDTCRHEEGDRGRGLPVPRDFGRSERRGREEGTRS